MVMVIHGDDDEWNWILVIRQSDMTMGTPLHMELLWGVIKANAST